MENTLITLAEFHYELGFIGIDEYQERIAIALWLSEEVEGGDPRLEVSEEDAGDDQKNSWIENEAVESRGKDSNRLEYICLGTWVFTKSDPDSYPSIPHGHYKSQSRVWPKLNPYTGRAFITKHKEDNSKRLSKKEMRKLWGDESFKSFCREMIVWYQEQFPYYEFHVRRPLRFPRW